MPRFPPAHIACLDAQAGAQRHIAKGAFPIVHVDDGCVLGEVSLDDIEAPLHAEIADAKAHAGLLHPIFTQGHSAVDALLAEGSVAIIAEEQTRRGIAGDIDVRPSVVIEIRGNCGQSVASLGPADAGCGRDIGEGAIAIIAIERMAPVGQALGTAAHRHALVIAACAGARARHRLCIEDKIVRHEQVELAIPIVIEKSATGAKARLRIHQSRCLGDVGEGAIAVVVIQRVLAPVSNEEVFKPVVVIIPDCHSVGESCAKQSGLPGHVGEGSVPVIFIQAVGGGGRRIGETRAREHQDVQPAIIVIVKEGGAAAHALEDVIVVIRMAADHGLIEPGLPRDIGEAGEERKTRALAARRRPHASRCHSLPAQERRRQGQPTQNLTPCAQNTILAPIST